MNDSQRKHSEVGRNTQSKKVKQNRKKIFPGKTMVNNKIYNRSVYNIVTLAIEACKN